MKSVFRRLETDSELRARLIEKIPPWSRFIAFVSGEQLDCVAWEQAQMQRRIVEDAS